MNLSFGSNIKFKVWVRETIIYQLVNFSALLIYGRWEAELNYLSLLPFTEENQIWQK